MHAASIFINDQFITHFNAGFNVLPNAKTSGTDKRNTLSGFTAGSSIIYMHNNWVNFMVEGLLESGQSTLPDVPGISFTTELLNRPKEHGVLFYLSIEPTLYN